MFFSTPFASECEQQACDRCNWYGNNESIKIIKWNAYARLVSHVLCIAYTWLALWTPLFKCKHMFILLLYSFCAMVTPGLSLFSFIVFSFLFGLWIYFFCIHFRLNSETQGAFDIFYFKCQASEWARERESETLHVFMNL